MTKIKIVELLSKNMGPLPKWFFGGLLTILLLGIPCINYYGNQCHGSNETGQTHTTILAAVKAAGEYNDRTGHYPATIDDLETGQHTNKIGVSSHKWTDGWGHQLRLVSKGKYLSVLSAGADGRFETNDDISN